MSLPLGFFGCRKGYVSTDPAVTLILELCQRVNLGGKYITFHEVDKKAKKLQAPAIVNHDWEWFLP